MDLLIKTVDLPYDFWVYLLIDIGLALLALWSIKILMGLRWPIAVLEELGKKDNFAFGIMMAGSLLSLCIVLSSVEGRHVGEGYWEAATGMLLFGVVGIVLVKAGRTLHDVLILDRIDTTAAILDRNTSVALVDAASAVASAIILRSMMLWVEGGDSNALIGIVSGYTVVLALLMVMTRLYEIRFARSNQNTSFQAALKKGQLAIAIEHAGNLLGTATIVTSASHLLRYHPDGYVSNVTGWLIMSIALSIALFVLNLVSKYLVFWGMNFREEVEQQHNVGVASLLFSLSIGMALVINGVLAYL